MQKIPEINETFSLFKQLSKATGTPNGKINEFQKNKFKNSVNNKIKLSKKIARNGPISQKAAISV